MEPVIEVSGVKILKESHEISFCLNKGEAVCIYGMNGSGKTLFIKALCGLFSPFCGSIKSNIDNCHRGVCLQYPEHLIFKETVYEEACIISGSAVYARELLAELNINGNQSPFDLSDGEKRLLFIFGLFKSKELLIFDEPFSSLDKHYKNQVVTKISANLGLGKSVIYTANRKVDTVFADKIISLL